MSQDCWPNAVGILTDFSVPWMIGMKFVFNIPLLKE
jgi:hypothetical protein